MAYSTMVTLHKLIGNQRLLEFISSQDLDLLSKGKLTVTVLISLMPRLCTFRTSNYLPS